MSDFSKEAQVSRSPGGNRRCPTTGEYKRTRTRVLVSYVTRNGPRAAYTAEGLADDLQGGVDMSDTTPPITEAVEQRFWSKVRKGPDCWEWTAGTHNTVGYGSFHFGGMRLAHRVAWVLTHGPLDPGQCVLHHCDNPPCVRPDHLFLGTKADNNRDRRAKGRSATGARHGFRLHPDRIPRGQQNGKSKLTPAGVKDIRHRLTAGETQASIARRYGVDAKTIRSIKIGRTWAWLR